MRTPWLTIRSRSLPISFRVNWRVPLVLLVLSLLTGLVLLINIGRGEYPIAPLEVFKTIFGFGAVNPDHAFVINTLRLPRSITAFLVGTGLAVSGAILQGLTRNPLAAPDIVGINAGASLAAVGLIILAPAAPAILLPIAAFGGALSVAVLVYLLAWGQGNSPMRLVLVGIGIAAIAGALTTLMLAVGEINSASQALIWMAGSVYGSTWTQIATLLPWLIVLLPLAWLLSRDLNVLHLGSQVAQGLGSQVRWQQTRLLCISVALAGATAAAAGNVGFVGLMAPHLARQLVGASYEGLLPTAALLGGLMVTLGDLIGRTVFPPTELPCGVITSIVGAPYFLYLLYRDRHR
jgi:iron complex transport system permease protein